MKIEAVIPEIVTQIMNGVTAANARGILCGPPEMVELSLPYGWRGRACFVVKLTASRDLEETYNRAYAERFPEVKR